jgi:glyoxylase I family protein
MLVSRGMRARSKVRLSLDHVVLEVADPARSVAFYRDVLGLVPVRSDEFAAGAAPFPSARIDATTLLDFFPKPMWRSKRPENPNHLCFTTTPDGMTSLKRRLARRRIPIARTRDHNFGARGIGRSIYFDDPDGISLEVRYYPRAAKGRPAMR